MGMSAPTSTLPPTMPTTTILAEKPSVARDLARVLGATARRDGYLELIALFIGGSVAASLLFPKTEEGGGGPS